ncbi:MAG: DUF3575 domain-containing protein, partial [Rikenellaceae bacterium]
MINRFFSILIVAMALTTTVDAQSVAIKTNLLYGAAAYTPNLGLEIGLGRKTTLDISGGYNPWNRDG